MVSRIVETSLAYVMVALLGGLLICLLIILTPAILLFVILHEAVRWLFISADPIEDHVVHQYQRLMEALERGDLQELDGLSSETPGFPDGSDGFLERTWLINAIHCGGLPAVEWVLAHKPDLDFEDDEGSTALSSAINREDDNGIDVVKLLIDAGADVNRPSRTLAFRPLHVAAMRGCADVTRLLLDAGADPSHPCNEYVQKTPLGYAQEHGYADVVAVLEAHQKDQANNTPAPAV